MNYQMMSMKVKKSLQKNFILNELVKKIDGIKKEDIRIEFCATSKTFKRYINRFNWEQP